MSHPMLKYWEEAYSEYSTGSNSYLVPSMTDPILSPRFNCVEGDYLNIIKDLDASVEEIPGYKIRNNFYLGRFKAKEIEFSDAYKITDLMEAKEDESFWELLKDGFDKDYQFLKILMDFLPTLNARFKVVSLIENNRPYGHVVVGMTETQAILLSGVIKSTHRNKKLSHKLIELTHLLMIKEEVEECFYWTISEKILNYADQIDRYLIYTKH
jgi:hypothetical protein